MIKIIMRLIQRKVFDCVLIHTLGSVKARIKSERVEKCEDI
jgi:hypothetical protein